jgi:hypothetical protein
VLASCFAVWQGTATLDFSGTGVEVYNNWNSPKAVCLSAVIYCLRCMVGHDIPLNEASAPSPNAVSSLYSRNYSLVSH